MTPLWIGAGAVLAIGLGWRLASQRRRLPCPSWLGWVLDNPYTAAVAGVDVMLQRAEIASGMRVLDVGAGVGRVTVPAARRVGPDGAVVAMDVQDGMLARVRAAASDLGLANVVTIAGSIEDGVPGAGDFDRALLITVLGEIPDRAAAMRALYAALRFDGLLSVTEMLPDPHFQRQSTVRRLAESAGFAWDRSFGFGMAYTMNFRKRAR